MRRRKPRVKARQPSAAIGCSVTSATYASSSVGSRVVTRPSETPSSRASTSCVGSVLGRRLHDDDLCLVAILDRDRGDALERADRVDAVLLDPVHLDLDDHALGDLLLEVAGRPLGDDLALRDDGDPVAERVCLEHVVRRQQDGLACLLEAADRRPQLPGADRVDPDRRLVEEETGGSWSKPAGDVEPLAHAARVALDPLLLTALEPDELEQLVDPRPLVRGSTP